MKILAAIDRSRFADRVVEQVLRIAVRGEAEVLLLNAAPREPDLLGQQLTRKVITQPVPAELTDRSELLERLAGQFRTRGISCETCLIRGKASATILDEAQRWGAELIVIGTHGRSMLYRSFVGSVSEEVLAARRMPVLVVPLDDPTG